MREQTEQENQQQEYTNGVFIQSQEELTEDVYNHILFKPKHKRINKEMKEFLKGLE